MKNDSAEYGSVHHPWGVIRLPRSRENIDLRLATTVRRRRTRTPAGVGGWSMTEQTGMTDEDLVDVGPIDYLALEFPEARVNGEGLAALLDLVDKGTVRILDLRAVKREVDGTFTEMEIADFDSDGTLDLAVFRGVSSGLLDDDDLSQAASLIEPGKVVALLVWENTWAAPFVSAMRRVGADVIASGRIPVDEVVAMLDELETEEAEAQAT